MRIPLSRRQYYLGIYEAKRNVNFTAELSLKPPCISFRKGMQRKEMRRRNGRDKARVGAGEEREKTSSIDEVIATDLASVYALDIHVSSHQSNRSVGRYSYQ